MKSFEKRIYLASPTMHGDEMKYMTEAYETNWMSTVGENINKVECVMADALKQSSAVALASGTSALHLALRLTGVKEGDYVCCSDLTFSASANPVLYEKAVPVFIDSERETWNMDPELLEKALEQYPQTKAVIAVSLYGVPAQLDRIRKICDSHGVCLIEDAAEALGAIWKGEPAGSYGLINCISFNGNKIITGSSGGMLLSHDKDLCDKARKWSTQSRENAPWYQHEDLGFNYRMSNVVAGVVRGQIPYLTEHIERKKEIYTRYKEGFKELPVRMNPFLPDAEPNYWLSCLTIDKYAMGYQKRTDLEAEYSHESGKSTPTEILETLLSLNAEGRPVWKPMHMQPIFQNYPFISSEDHVSEDLFERGLCLPSDIKMTEEEQNRIIAVVKSCFK